MKMHIEALLVRLQVLTLGGIVAAQALGKPSLASLLFTLTFFLSFGLWLAMAIGKLSNGDLLAVFLLAASCLSVTVNALLTATVVSFSYFKKLIIFWTTILLFSAMGKYQTEAADVRFVFRWNTILVVFLIGMYFLRRDQMYQLNGIVTIYLTFGFTNPNLVAVFLSAACMIERIHGAAVSGKMEKLLHGVLAGFLIFFVWETRARNAQLLLMAFLLARFVLSLFPKWMPEMKGWFAGLIAVLPLVFAVGYLGLIRIPSVQRLFSFWIGEGKGLDSRVEIWTFALRSFVSSPLTGAYSEISGGTGASQMHNSHLDILASYGAPVCILTCAFLFLMLYGKRQQSGRVHFLCQMGFAALLMSGIGEAMLFSGGMGIHLFGGVLLMLMNFDFEHGDGIG